MDQTVLEKDPRSPTEKVRLFRQRFSGLEHVYGTYDPATGRSWQVKRPVTPAVVLRHLQGSRPLGIYLLTGDRTRAIVVDFDTGDANLPLDFMAAAAHYKLDTHMEVSKSKGFHVWLFAEPTGLAARKGRAVVQHILRETEAAEVEVFPKQDSINLERGEVGNWINLPLNGRLVRTGKTVFVDTKTGLQPFPNQWAYLESVGTVSEGLLDEIIEVNDIDIGSEAPPPLAVTFEAPWTLPPCIRRMLDEGVTECQRVSCFRLAVQLRRMGMPYDIVVAALLEWRTRNRPEDGKGIITENEVKAQAASAFLKEYRGHGCEEPAVARFCSPDCPVAASLRTK